MDLCNRQGPSQLETMVQSDVEGNTRIEEEKKKRKSSVREFERFSSAPGTPDDHNVGALGSEK